MKDLTAENLRACAAHLRDRFRARMYYKGDNAFMKVVAAFLDALRIQSKKTFMERYSLTLGRNIYLCFRLGEDNPPLLAQLRTIGHECEHIVVRDREGAGVYDFWYVCSTAKRALYEARCYVVNMEVQYLYTKARTGVGEVRPIEMAPLLAAYGCKASDARAAQRVIDQAAEVLRRGGVGTRAAQEIGRWFGWL